MARFLSFLASMRLAISLLAVVGIASSIGTIIKQNEPQVNYLNQFGPFWYEVFHRLGFFSIYTSLPFLAILTFLLCSTSLCIWRQTPAIWRDFCDRRAHAHRQALLRLPHQLPLDLPANAFDEAQLRQALTPLGGRLNIAATADGWLASIRHGRWQRLGYIFTHVAIVVICLGGLLDGQFPLRLQTFFGQYQTVAFTDVVDRLPENSVLPADHASYRANLFIPEGESRDLGLVVVENGRLWQKLPFSVRLKKFSIAHYENGMPKNFASDIVIERNASTPANTSIPEHGLEATLLVNQPLHVDGTTIFQAGFDDGGSSVSLEGFSMDTLQALPSVTAVIGDKATFTNHSERYVMELTDFRVFNIERRPNQDEAEPAKQGFAAQFANLSGTAGRSIASKSLRNFGPKFTYKLRNQAGQAVEVQTYMLPVEMDEGHWFWLSGIRDTPTDPFRYLSVPIYDGEGLQTWIAIKRLLRNDTSRQALVNRYVHNTAMNGQVDQLAEPVNKATAEFIQQGLGFLDELMAPSSMPSSRTRPAAQMLSEPQRLKVAETLIAILRGVVFEAWADVRRQAGLPPPEQNEASERYVQDVMMALNSSVHYPAPLLFQLTAFEEKPATVVQIARAPGQGLVYLGCAMLILGVMLMIFVQDRRLYVWCSNDSATPSFLAGIVRRGPNLTTAEFTALQQNIMSRLR